MAYGFRSRSKGSSSSYRRRFGGFGRFASSKTYGRRVAYTRKGFIKKTGEKKYFDKTYLAQNSEVLTGIGATRESGVTYISSIWATYNFGTVGPPLSISNNMLMGLDTGNTARTRIGNKIKTNYIKGAFTFNAAAVNKTISTDGQGGETYVSATASAGDQYLRTTYRFVLVKDLQVNSGDTEVTWQQVFDTTGNQAGVHSELNVDNMGRFIVLGDKIFTVDAQTPQKTIPFMLKGSSVGNIRYNGSTDVALTDKGIYVIYAAFVMGYESTLANITLPSPVGHSRLCFTDE